MKKIAINTTILTLVEGAKPLRNGAIGWDQDQICYIGPVPTEEELDTYDQVMDYQGKIVMPGLVNAHGHTAMTLLRGYADDLPLKRWLEEEMWPLEAKMTRESVRAGSALAALEMIESGTTTFLDMYDKMDAVGEVTLQSGLRARLMRGCIGFGSDELRAAKLQEASQFAKDWNGEGEGRIRTMMSPHSPYTCDPAYITAFIEKAVELDIPVHTHMSETLAEVEQNVRDYGVRPVEHLRKLGFFNLPSLVAHAVHLTDEELEVLAQYDVKVAHNPESNLKLGSGIARIPEMLQKGIRPALATDGAASNNNLDMLEEVHVAAMIHKGANLDPLAVPAATALAMGTKYGAEALFWSEEIGTLEVGKQADFITFDSTVTHFQPLHDEVSHIVYSASKGDIRDVFVAGKQLMRDREVLTLDKEKVIYEAQLAWKELAK